LERTVQKVAAIHVRRAGLGTTAMMALPAMFFAQYQPPPPSRVDPHVYLYGAYFAAWTIYISYLLLLATRLAKLRKETAQLGGANSSISRPQRLPRDRLAGMTVETHNALAQASSSYLRSAMHQPIHWHEWGTEAFEKAQGENKPILLDIGAVWCHWCHVMDRESYEDEGTAAIINEHFIAIKVDRDERPDVDSRYQTAVQAISGQGGWPLTAFLTPDGKPFFAGTYFPPQDHHGRPSFRRVLLTLAQAYREKNSDVVESAESVMDAIGRAEGFAGQSGPLAPQLIDSMVESAVKLFDADHGGFGASPKFPHPSALDLVMQRYAETGNQHFKNIAAITLEKMAQGGVYDQLAGGFHRYSVDEHWIVPHFEKMAYDNSELLKNYVHGYQLTRNPFFAAVAEDIIRWMDEWLSDREHGGFYASQDADYSLDDDGDYFTWTLDETKSVLSGEELEAAVAHYDIGEVGEMHHNPQ